MKTTQEHELSDFFVNRYASSLTLSNASKKGQSITYCGLKELNNSYSSCFMKGGCDQCALRITQRKRVR